MTEWKLAKTFASSGGDVAYDVFGRGPAVVLVHGTPASSYLWRRVVARLADEFTVYVHDLLGYGRSEKLEGQDVSIQAQTTVLAELLDEWGLEQPGIAGHDIGGAITMRLALLEQRSFHRVALCDAAVIDWITPFSQHVQRHLDAFHGVPPHIHRSMIAAHLRSAFASTMSDEDLEPYLDPWLGPEGQAAYYRQLAQLDESYTKELEPRFEQLRVPTLVLWGEQDGWLDPEVGKRLAAAIPEARWAPVPGAGHFAQEDRPDAVAERLAEFFRTT